MGRAKSVNLPTPTMKTLGVSSSYSKHKFGLKKHKICLEEEDRISKLPDELVVSILSLLTITEAGRTSVLSHRWESLWISYHGSLDFDLSKRLFKVKEKLWPQERSKYLNWTNQVLRRLMLFGSSSNSAFTVRFDDWDRYPKCLIDGFVEFAMAKRIQRLELDMNPIELGTGIDPYTFPIEYYAWIKQPCGLNRISALTSLTLKNINVTGEFIEYFLSNCPLLERLCVVNSEQLSNLKVTGAGALKLKYLEIECCDVESVEISAPNLLSLYYIGTFSTKLHVENVPKLVEVSIGRDVITYMSSSLSSYLSQLQSLLLEFEIEVTMKFTQFVALSKLKHLILRVVLSKEESLLGWTSLIEASPLLQKFTLEAITSESDYRKKVRKVQKVNASHPHRCLKVVELLGFTGNATEVELAMYFVENAPTLEQIVIDPRQPFFRGTPYDLNAVQLKGKRNRGRQLKKFLPPGVDLVFI